MVSKIGCYNHINCEDRPAVATCTKCGKGLCAECADELRSPSTGKVLCVDCLNEEIEATAVRAVVARKTTKKELTMIIVGFVIGLILSIVIAVAAPDVYYLAFFMPTLFASFGTIFQMCRGYGLFVGILFFIGLMIASPVIFLWRLIVRIRDMVALKRFAIYQIRYIDANENYFQLARSMTSQKANPEQIRAELEQKYAALRQSDKAEYEKKVAEGIASQMAEMNKKLAEMDKIKAEMAEMQKDMANASSGVDKASKALGRKNASGRASIDA